MRHSTSVRHALLLACVAAVAASADAAEKLAPESYTPDYFTQFQASTALDMATHLPGFVFDGGNAARGAAGNVLINGKRPASKSDTLGDALGRIPAGAVLRIDLISGGSGDIDMQGHTEVANIVLKTMDLVSASTSASTYVTADGQLHPGFDGNYSLKRRDRSVDVALRWNTSPDTSQGEGHRTTLHSGATTATETTIIGAGASDNKAVRLNYGQDVLDGQLNLNAAYSPWSYRSRIAYESDSRALATNDNGGRTLEQGLAYTRALAHAASMDLKALYRSSAAAGDSRMTYNGDTSRNVSTSRASEQILGGQLSWQPSEDVVIRGGLEHALTTNDSGNAYQPTVSAAALPGAEAWTQESRIESQLSSAWQVGHAINAEAGVRIEYSSLSTSSDQAEAKAYVYPKPRLRLSLSPSPSLQLRLRMEREVSQLNFGDGPSYLALSDKTLRAGVPDLVPAKTWLCEGALEYRFWERGAAVLSYTQSHISDVIDRMPIHTAAATYDAAGNIGAASADSVTGMLNLPTDGWSLPQGLIKLSTTWKSSAVTDPTTQATRRLSGEQPLAWRVEFSQDLPRQRTAWGFSLDNGWSNDSWQVAERDTSSGTGWARAFINYRPAPNMTLGLELNNLAGRVISYDRTHYAGDRLAGGVDLIEHNTTRTQPFALLRLRRDW
jgi:hypothetical protein